MGLFVLGPTWMVVDGTIRAESGFRGVLAPPLSVEPTNIELTSMHIHEYRMILQHV